MGFYFICWVFQINDVKNIIVHQSTWEGGGGVVLNQYLTIIPWVCVGYELAITISYPTSTNGIIVLLNFSNSKHYNWILRNFILNNITKWPDIDVTSDIKPRENHMSAPFANLVEWKNLKEFKQITQVKGKCLS